MWVSLKISQNLQENICARFFFLISFIKIRLWHRCFSVNCTKFLRTPFLQNCHRTTAIRLLITMWLITYNHIAIYGYDLKFHSHNHGTIMDTIFEIIIDFESTNVIPEKFNFCLPDISQFPKNLSLTSFGNSIHVFHMKTITLSEPQFS